MANPGYRDNFPRGALLGAGLLIAATLVTVAGVRIEGISPAAQVPLPSAPAASRALKFEDRADGNVVVYAIEDGSAPRKIAVLVPGTNGFLRAVMRGLARARQLRGIGSAVPFQLTEFADGRLVLSDPTTGRRIYLRAFGPTNAQAFARLLPQAAQRRRQLAEQGHG